MKKQLLSVLLCCIIALGLSAQEIQTSGNLTVRIESTRIIGDRLLVSGKMSVNKEVRLMNINVNAVVADGDSHTMRELWWGGKVASISAFDKTLQPDIPYSFDFAIATQNKNMNPVTAILVDIRDWTSGTNLKLTFKDIKVPMISASSTASQGVEIDKNIYLKWTKNEETAAGLKINFVVTNLSNKDMEMTFRSFDNAKIIDKEGSVYNGTLSFKDNVNFPAGTPISGFISIKEPVKMSDVIMIQFESRYFKYSIKDIPVAK